ncbi:MAG: antibiotic biosynthesis monooxygenase [Tannerellaceae bacterium]|nr:antibiotic biosynthesis monooxygenase [Tannerellaceae bacterium]
MKNVWILMACCLFILSGCCNSTEKTGCEIPCCSSEKEDMQYVMNIPRKIKPEHVAAFKESFEKCKVETLKEPGCLDYGMYQSYTDSTEFMIVETWKNKAAHLEHMETPYLKVHIEEIQGVGEPGYSKKMAEIYVCPHVNN